MSVPSFQALSTDQVSIEEINRRPIKITSVLIAHQLVLIPLYFFLPFWIFVFNSTVLSLVYLSQVKNKFNLIKGLKVILTLVAVAGVFASFHRLAGRDAGVSLIAIMYGLKIIEIESKRDVYILMLLGFFLLLATFLFSSSALIAIYQFIPVLAILYALQSIHRIDDGNSYRSTGVVSNRITFFNSSSRYLFSQLVKYLMLALPIMIVLFLFFPRLSGPIWKMPGNKNATSGISETMTPGAISSLHLSDEIAFRAKFYGDEPTGSEFYWRTLVLDTFDGLTWTHVNNVISDNWAKERNSPFQKIKTIEKIKSNQSTDLSTDTNRNYRYEIALEATQQNWLTFLDKPSRVISIAKVLNDASVSTTRKLFARIKYRAESQTGLSFNKVLQSRSLYTSLPKGYNPRSMSWAKKEREKSKTDEQFIQSILKKIHQEEYFYTLSPPVMDENTVDSFLFDEQKGFCEHYAGTLVFLARAVNIPARVVIGYQGAEKNLLSDYWIVRHSNAHAWTEIWFAGKGWVRVDPTAAIAKHRIEEQLLTDYAQRGNLFESFEFDSINVGDIPFSKQFEFWLDQLDSGWNNWFLEYNLILQKQLMTSLGLDKLSREQIALLSLLAIIVFMLFINMNWRFKKGKTSILFIAIRLLNKKLSKYNIKIQSNHGFDEFLSHLKLGNTHPINDSSQVKLSQKSIRRLETLLQFYLSIRYSQNNCSIEEQKAFYARVKKLKLSRSAK
ncbi:MAG: hypothetical protein COA86_16530 [Kangiella sp.]|nr:MAG: hypothetical protein COA86_16530 [Kangiella sp.]